MKKRKIVAFLGHKGSYSHAMVGKWYRRGSVDLRPFNSFGKVVDSVLSGKADIAVLPFWNIYDSFINEAVEVLLGSQLCVTKVGRLDIHLQLASSAESIGDIKTLFSKSNVFDQCSDWIEANLPGVTLKEASSTSAAVRHVKGKKSAGAIGSRTAAMESGVPIKTKGIQNPDNYTLFFNVEREQSERCRGDTYTLYALRPKRMKALATNGSWLCYPSREVKKICDEEGFLTTQLIRTSPRTSRKLPWIFLEGLGYCSDLNSKSIESKLRPLMGRIILLGSYSGGITALTNR